MSEKESYSWMKHLDFIIIDLLSLIASFMCAFAWKFHQIDFINEGEWTVLLTVVCVSYIIITLFMNPYSGIFRRKYYEEIFRTALVTIYNFLIVCVFLYLFKMGALYSREVMIITYPLYFVVSLILKYIWKKLLTSGIVRGFQNKLRTVFVVAERDHVERFIKNALAEDMRRYDIKGIYLIDGDGPDRIQDVLVLAKDADFVDYVIENQIEEVLLGVRPSELNSEQYDRLIQNGVKVHLEIEAMLGLETDQQLISKIGVYKTLQIGRYRFTREQKVYFVFKRILDILFGLVGCICLLPVMLFVKIVSLASGDKASIFYTQKRIGKNGKEIKIFKFRSMVTNSAEILEELLKDEKYRAEWEANQKFENDPRITKIGKFLRKTSLDEVPQFINVLKGDMSLIGPRPLVPGELEEHGGLKLYNMIRPGITGWWGCNGRSNIEYKERLELEYYYVKNCSFYLDILCVIRTVFAVLERDGAK